MQESWVMLKGSSRGRWILLIVLLCVVSLGTLKLWHPEILKSLLTAIIEGFLQLRIWILQAANAWGDFFRSLSSWSR